jgi:hypothetical protein
MESKWTNKPRDVELEEHLSTRLLESWIGQLTKLSVEIGVVLRGYKKQNANDPFALLKWLRSIKAETAQIGEQSIGEIRQALEDEVRNRVMTFDTDLREALSKQGMRIHGQWPHYYVALVLKLEVDEKTLSVRIADENISTLHVRHLIEIIAHKLKTLESVKFQPQEFLDLLVQAHDRLTLGTTTNSVSVWPLFKEVLCSLQSSSFWKAGRARLFRPFDEQQYRGAITDLMISNTLRSRDGREMRLLPPIKAEDGIYVYQPAEDRFGYVGRIEFNKRG